MRYAAPVPRRIYFLNFLTDRHKAQVAVVREVMFLYPKATHAEQRDAELTKLKDSHEVTPGACIDAGMSDGRVQGGECSSSSSSGSR